MEPFFGDGCFLPRVVGGLFFQTFGWILEGSKVEIYPLKKKQRDDLKLESFLGAVNPGVGSRDVKFHDVFFCDSLIGARVDQLTLFPYNRGWSSTH